MNGGWGNDTFFFGRGHNADKIEDFGRDIPGGNNDVIALDPLDFNAMLIAWRRPRCLHP